jgi:hypothetical protein
MLHLDLIGAWVLHGDGVEHGHFYSDSSVSRFHGDNSVLRLHGDDPDPGDGSVEVGRFRGDGLNPADA